MCIVPLVCDPTGWFKLVLKLLRRSFARPGSSSNSAASRRRRFAGVAALALAVVSSVVPRVRTSSEQRLA
jgi:hypothetical protein